MPLRSVAPRHALLTVSLAAVVVGAACQPEQRPTPGSVRTIGSPAAGSASTSTTESVSGPEPAASPAAAPQVAASPPGGVAPAGSPAARPGSAASPSASPSPAAAPSKPDGIYTPITNREIYQAVSSDYQAIVALTNQVNEGKPLPSAEILDIYENARFARTATAARPMRAFARDEARGQEFPEAARFYGTPTFLDTPVMDAINGTGSAASYTPAQRRQAIQKGLVRILAYWSRRYVQQAGTNLSPGTVDEGWAIYMGQEVNGTYPNSLSAVAASREANFNRPSSLDAPLRQALSRAQQAATRKDQAAYDAAAQEVSSRFNAIFYLSTARYLDQALKSAQAGKPNDATAQQMEGLSYYQTIQPTVASADTAADRAVVAYFTAAPASLTAPLRDEALAALNRAQAALLLTSADLVTPATFSS